MDTDDLTCDYVFNDPWGHPENILTRLVRWYKNNVLMPALNDYIIIDQDDTIAGDQWKCSVSVANLYNQSGFFDSPEVTIGDDVPPYNTTSPTISALTECTEGGTSTVSINLTDDGSNIGTTLLEVTTQTDTVNLTMDCTGNNSAECTKVLTGYSAQFSTNKIYFSDSSNNWAYVDFNYTIDVHTCVIFSGGGGGGGGPLETVYFRTYPRVTTAKGNQPAEAVVVGDQSKKYTLVPLVTNTQINIFVQQATFKDSANNVINSTDFFKVSPLGLVRMQKENISIVVYCDIPPQYHFLPFGVFNSTIIIQKEGTKFQESIPVTCESQEHFDGAGSLSTILNQPIGFLGLTIGEIWFVAILTVVVVTYRASSQKKKRR